LAAIMRSFRFLVYSSKVVLDGIPDFSRIDTLNTSGGETYTIYGNEFSEFTISQQSKTFLLSNCGAFLRANLLIATYERTKGYCFSNSVNTDKFLCKIPHDYQSDLQILHILRHVATHWNPEGKIKWYSDYPKEFDLHGIKMAEGILEKELDVNDVSLLSLLRSIHLFVENELV
jgi:hypothetical protein